MSGQMQQELEAAIRSEKSLDEIVAMLRQYRARGVTRDEVYAFLQGLREKTPAEAMEDRILEVADFVAGFCSPHMKIWDS